MYKRQVAICPSEAVSIPEYDMEDVEAYDKDTFTLKAEHYLHAVKFRRSIRNFKPEKIEREKACLLYTSPFDPE